MKTYCDKTRARYAAKRELAKVLGREPQEIYDFEIIPQPGRKFAWVVPASVDFEPVTAEDEADAAAEAQAEAAGGDAEFDNRPARTARKARKAKVADVVVVKQPAEDLPEPAPELPTSFVPDAKAGEIASAEYGMLTTRERAAEAAKAAGVSDPVITQTVRGMWVWRTPALNTVWRESQKPPKGGPKGPKAERPAKAPQKAGHAGKMSAKHETALALIKRPQGASAAEIAKETGWLEHSARARVAADLIGKFNLPITKAKEGERGKVYRFAAEAEAA
jgi:hypothetical protein